MGQITIKKTGSFPDDARVFSAIQHGHADAVAQAIEYLASVVLPEATALDHRLHNEAAKPAEGWQRKGG
jgi:hypothetical protein